MLKAQSECVQIQNILPSMSAMMLLVSVFVLLELLNVLVQIL